LRLQPVEPCVVTGLEYVLLPGVSSMTGSSPRGGLASQCASWLSSGLHLVVAYSFQKCKLTSTQNRCWGQSAPLGGSTRVRQQCPRRPTATIHTVASSSLMCVPAHAGDLQETTRRQC
jgi:hypothetical protein